MTTASIILSKARRAAKGSRLESKFALIWKAINGPELVLEHKPISDRKWRIDFAHIPTMTAIECEGGVFGGGRHTRGKGFIADCEKYNTLTMYGWSVIRLPGPMITMKNLSLIKSIISRKTK